MSDAMGVIGTAMAVAVSRSELFCLRGQRLQRMQGPSGRSRLWRAECTAFASPGITCGSRKWHESQERGQYMTIQPGPPPPTRHPPIPGWQ